MVSTILAVIWISIEGGTTSKINKARFWERGLTRSPPKFLERFSHQNFQKKKKMAGEDPLDPLLLGEFSVNKDEWVKVLRVQERQLERKECQNSKNREKTASQKKVSLVLFALLPFFVQWCPCAHCALYILSDDKQTTP
jgi:hypothetical protein